MSEIMNLYCEVKFTTPVILVLEPSSALWADILRVATEIIDSFPGRVKRVYFLGQKEHEPVRTSGDLKRDGPRWLRRGIDRPILINPILEELKEEKFTGIIVIVSSRLPLDIEDWEGTDVPGRMIFVNMGDGEIEGPCRVIGRSNINLEIAPLMNIEPGEVFVSGDGFVPVNYSVEPCRSSETVFRDGEFILNIEPSSERLKIHLAAICGDRFPELIIRRHNGTEKVSFREEKPWFNQEWNRIPDDLREIIKSAAETGKFRCPCCGEKHDADTLICPSGDLILRGLPAGRCILFRGEEYISLTHVHAYPLEDGKIITSEGKIYRLKDDGWEYLKDVEPYERVADDLFGLFYKI
ncbi:hypothetical protein DNK57_01360 [Methanothermobacter thermautotrophicus]|jgi:hypothetical protein|uniref:Uncharacterized protein n=1 Tax=Methanothermobacter thermautotrophicus TaxID=145262 RepID=A0A842YLJ9_METTF|nr:hypothetical protein [Methanothermobacter thermautotrophicus]MBE2899480.1 hypothetical protein [Methanothermobacter thermautotrophicus]MCQ8904643.1 hypothetical protein [Methanothermobacter sp.]